MPDTLTVAEAAARLGVTRARISALIKAGRLTVAVRYPHMILLDRAAVETFTRKGPGGVELSEVKTKKGRKGR